MSLWLKRDLITGPYLRLCLSAKEYEAELKSLKLAKGGPFPSERGIARCNWYTHKNGDLMCFVCLHGDVLEDRDGPQIAALIVHEAVHVFQRYRNWVGESKPSSEFEAYSIQTISQRLMYAFIDQTKKAARRRPSRSR